MKTFIPIKSENIKVNSFDKNYFLVKNLNTEKYLRISENIAQALEMTDGKRSINNIYNKISNKKISIEELYSIYTNPLSEYGIILNGKKRLKQGKKSHSYLTFRKTIFDSKTVNKISKLLSNLFHPVIFFSFITAFVLTIVFIFIWHTRVVSYDLLLGFRVGNLLLLFLGFLIGLFHEFGHSSALHYFNEKPREIGVGLYLIFPVFFSSITNAWSITNKRNRLIINFGGIYFEIILITLGLVFFIFTQEITILFLCALNLLVILYNLNPLIRTDGYWLLSDLTNTPNLMSVSSQRMKLFFKYFFLKKKNEFYRKDIFLISYAIISKIYIIGIVLTLFVYNRNEIISFLPKMYKLIFNFDLESVQDIQLYEITIPLIFYIITVKYAVKQIKNTAKKS